MKAYSPNHPPGNSQAPCIFTSLPRMENTGTEVRVSGCPPTSWVSQSTELPSPREERVVVCSSCRLGGTKGGREPRAPRALGAEASKGTAHFFPNSAQSWLCLRGQFSALFLLAVFLTLGRDGSPPQGLGLGRGLGRCSGALGSRVGNAEPGALPAPLPTSGAVGDDGHGEVHLVGVHVRGGADGVVPGLQNRELGEQEAGRHPQGRELLQHLQKCGAVGELPLVVI